MGCISSKAITRSMSIREELSHGFQSRSAVWEELLTSHSAAANDHQLFAFVCSSNVHTHTPKLNTSTFTFPPQTPPSTNHLVDACNAKPDPQNDSSKFTRSKSCHTVGGSRLDLKDKSVAGSRSFHTVEEYDALLLLERIRGTRSFDDCFPWDEDEDKDDVMKLQPGEDVNEEESSSVKSGENCEAGWKRKAVARGLKSLDISTPAPGIARMKQRMVVQGQIYSPGTYVTPKFGSYNDPAVRRRRQENAVFSPELVAAFEDCMQQLQVDEDSILRHIYG